MFWEIVTSGKFPSVRPSNLVKIDLVRFWEMAFQYFPPLGSKLWGGRGHSVMVGVQWISQTSKNIEMHPRKRNIDCNKIPKHTQTIPNYPNLNLCQKTSTRHVLYILECPGQAKRRQTVPPRLGELGCPMGVAWPGKW